MGSATPKFQADAMLGRLAKWLRLLGVDTAYDPALRGPALLRLCERENRILLTRDTRLSARRRLPQHLFVRDDDFRAQLRQVAAEFALPLRPRLDRCSRCNAALQSASRQSVRDLVPPYVFQTQSEFARCRACQRVYWPATHLERIAAELRHIAGSAAAGP